MNIGDIIIVPGNNYLVTDIPNETETDVLSLAHPEMGVMRLMLISADFPIRPATESELNYAVGYLNGFCQRIEKQCMNLQKLI